MTPVQLQKAMAALQSRGVRPDCSECGKTNWMFQTTFFKSPGSNGQNIDLANGMITVCRVCTNCGAAKHHATKMLGID